MKKAEIRVQIAKDVIKQITTGKLKPQNGVFLERAKAFKTKDEFTGCIKEGYGLFNEELEHPEQLCDILKTLPCKVCALGGMFAETVKRFNKFESVTYVDMDTGYDYLEKYFTKEQLDMIEFTFELGKGRITQTSVDGLIRVVINEFREDMGSQPLGIADTLAKSCLKFGKLHRKGAPRMVAIMKNIIKNGGTFKPE